MSRAHAKWYEVIKFAARHVVFRLRGFCSARASGLGFQWQRPGFERGWVREQMRQGFATGIGECT